MPRYLRYGLGAHRPTSIQPLGRILLRQHQYPRSSHIVQTSYRQCPPGMQERPHQGKRRPRSAHPRNQGYGGGLAIVLTSWKTGTRYSRE